MWRNVALWCLSPSEMSPFSDADVVVFSNCDSVRLSVYDDTESWTLPVVHAQGHMPNAPVDIQGCMGFLGSTRV